MIVRVLRDFQLYLKQGDRDDVREITDGEVFLRQ